MREIGIITSEHDPMYEVKRWLFWHSDIGVKPKNLGEDLRHEAELHEAELDARNPLMCKFTKRVMKAIRSAQDEAYARRDMGTYGKLGKIYHKYHLRLVHFQRSEQEKFYLFSPESSFSCEEGRKALIEKYSGKDRS